MFQITKSFKTMSVACVIATGLLLAACGDAVVEPAIPQGAGIHTWYENGGGGRYVVSVVEGRLPVSGRDSLAATVLTDSDCAPDAQGLNHCHNIIQFKDGTRISVIDNHQMTRHRCLRPGEPVEVTRLNAEWVVVKVGMQ